MPIYVPPLVLVLNKPTLSDKEWTRIYNAGRVRVTFHKIFIAWKQRLLGFFTEFSFPVLRAVVLKKGKKKTEGCVFRSYDWLKFKFKIC